MLSQLLYDKIYIQCYASGGEIRQGSRPWPIIIAVNNEMSVLRFFLLIFNELKPIPARENSYVEGAVLSRGRFARKVPSKKSDVG